MLRYVGMRPCCRALWLMAMLGSMHRAQAQDLPHSEMTRTSQPPVVDGRLSDACWERLERLPLKPFGGKGKPRPDTSAQVGTDGTWLFVGFTCEDHTPLTEGEPTYVRNALKCEDRVELYIQPDRDSLKYYFFQVSALGEGRAGAGRLLSARKTKGKTGLPFDPHWRYAAARTTNGWSVEVAIPALYLFREAPGADVWGVNFCRGEASGEPVGGRVPHLWSAWSLPEKSFHEPSSFGVLEAIPETVEKPAFAPVLLRVESGPGTEAHGGADTMGREVMYPVYAWLRNDGAETGLLHAVLDDVRVGGGRQEIEKEFLLSPGPRVRKRFEIVHQCRMNEITPDPVMTVGFEDALGVWTSSLPNFGGSLPEQTSVIDAYTGRNVYTTEEQARVWYTVQEYATDQLVRYTLRVRVLNDAGKALWQRSGLTPSVEETHVTIPLAGIPTGHHSAELTLHSVDGTVLAETLVPLAKLDPLSKGTEVKIDRYNRCLLRDGKPFFIIDTALQRGSEQHLQSLVDIGFNTLWRWYQPHWQTRGMSETELADLDAERVVSGDLLLNWARDRNVMVIDNLRFMGIWHFGYGSREFVTNAEKLMGFLPRLLTAARHHPAYLGSYLFDEPGDRMVFPGPKPVLAISEQIMSVVKAVDPYHPVWNNGAGVLPGPGTRQGDLLSPYWSLNVYRRRGPGTAEITKIAARTARQMHKPFLPMVKTEWNTGVCAPILPRENAAQTYLALVHGAAGISYWTSRFWHRDTVASLRELCSQMRTLAPALLRRPPPQDIHTLVLRNGEPVDAPAAVELSMRVMPDGTPILLAVNVLDVPVTFQCRIPSIGQGVTVESAFTEDGAAILRDGVLSEELEALATRAYRFKGWRLTEHTPTGELVVTEDHRHGMALMSGTGENAVSNGAFESGGGWRIVAGRGGKREAIAYAPGGEYSGEGRRGGYALRLHKRQEEHVHAESATIRLHPGRRYRLSAWVKTDATSKPDEDWGYIAALTYAVVNRDSVDGDDVRLPAMIPIKLAHQAWKRGGGSSAYVIETGSRPMDLKLQVRHRVAANVWIDDVSIEDEGSTRKNPLGRQRATRNLINNSSFEHARMTRWPDWWVPHTWHHWVGIGGLGTENAAWGQSTNRPYHGQWALKVQPVHITDDNRQGVRRMGYSYWEIPIEPETDYVFSGYFRADAPGIPVKVIVPHVGSATFEAGREWKRYSFSGTYESYNPKGLYRAREDRTRIDVRFTRASPDDPDACVYMDALQLEAGTDPTPYVPDGWSPDYVQFE